MAAGFHRSHTLPRAHVGVRPALQTAQPISSRDWWHLHAGSTTWPTRSSQAAAASKMPPFVPSPRLAKCPCYHPKWADGWHRTGRQCLEMGIPWKIRKQEGHKASAGFRCGLEKSREGKGESPVCQEQSGTAHCCRAGACSAPAGAWPSARATFRLSEEGLTGAGRGGGLQAEP